MCLIFLQVVLTLFRRGSGFSKNGAFLCGFCMFFLCWLAFFCFLQQSIIMWSSLVYLKLFIWVSIWECVVVWFSVLACLELHPAPWRLTDRDLRPVNFLCVFHPKCLRNVNIFWFKSIRYSLKIITVCKTSQTPHLLWLYLTYLNDWNSQTCGWENWKKDYMNFF